MLTSTGRRRGLQRFGVSPRSEAKKERESRMSENRAFPGLRMKSRVEREKTKTKMLVKEMEVNKNSMSEREKL